MRERSTCPLHRPISGGLVFSFVLRFHVESRPTEAPAPAALPAEAAVAGEEADSPAQASVRSEMLSNHPRLSPRTSPRASPRASPNFVRRLQSTPAAVSPAASWQAARGTSLSAIGDGDLEGKQGEGLRLLIADDSSANRRILAFALTKALPPCEMVFASSGDEALKLLRASLVERAFDIAFIDEHFDMEGVLKGTDVTQTYRELESSWFKEHGRTHPRLIVVGVSGDAGDATFERVAAASGQDCIWGKPLPSSDEMRLRLSTLLETRAMASLPTSPPPSQSASFKKKKNGSKVSLASVVNVTQSE